MPNEYRREDVLKHTVDTFCNTVALKLRQLYTYVPKGSNSTLTGQFIEEVVKGFIQNWIGHRLYLTGTFCEFNEHPSAPLQIDGIVYDPTAGPVVLKEGSFVVVHPVFCSSVIEVKTSCNNLPEFQRRLADISTRYMHHTVSGRVMGVIIHDPNPEEQSKKGLARQLYNYSTVGQCPIFILFQEKEGEYLPFRPAIEAMIKGIYDKQNELTNYL